MRIRPSLYLQAQNTKNKAQLLQKNATAILTFRGNFFFPGDQRNSQLSIQQHTLLTNKLSQFRMQYLLLQNMRLTGFCVEQMDDAFILYSVSRK